MGGDICKSVQVSQSSKQHSKQQPPSLIKQHVAIKSKAVNRVLDICQDKDALGTLIIYQDYKQQNQRFDVLQSGEHYYIRCCKSQKYLTVGSNSDKNSAPIFQQPVSGIPGQKFRLEKISGNEYFIYTFCGKVLDCNEKQTANGTRIVQNDCTREEDQKWIIQ